MPPDITQLLINRTRPSVDLYVALVQRLAALARANHMRLFVVLMPGRSFVAAPKSLSSQYQDHLRRSALQRLSGAKLKMVDLATQLRTAYSSGARNLYYLHDGHLTPKGHRLVAEILKRAIR